MEGNSGGRKMRVILLGSGSYSGTPKVLCECENCSRARRFPQYRRTRFSMYIPQINVLIDPSPDLYYHMSYVNYPALSEGDFPPDEL